MVESGLWCGEREQSEGGRKFINFLIKAYTPQFQINKRGREVVERLVEIVAQREVG